ncbi:hypothetical protein KIF24_28600 [Micromonospora sp. Llam7]|uniref:hypothetical protein n=1 Tax=Micromonospora tarapacensis TaxID=2835305 RepID=UPI001C835167|nr:hypothetical protein [Micromonospora tarapacensis]MBX7269580.1 hypothetical protein [Micromonospora tarapacensis]
MTAGAPPRFLTEPGAVLVEVVADAEPLLDPAAIGSVIGQVAPTRAELRRLARALHADPGLLTSGEPDGPRLLQDLIGALLTVGARHVRPASCARCRRMRPLRRRLEDRLVCAPCANAAAVRREACARCQRERRVDGRDGDGAPLCAACTRQQRGADPLGELVDGLDRLGTGLPASALRELILAALPRPHQRRTVTADFAARPTALADNAAHGSHHLVLLAEALIAAGATDVALPVCPFCQQSAKIRFGRDGLRCCKRCYEASRSQPCTRCGRARPVAERTADGAALCKACGQRDPVNFETCARCGQHARLVPTDSGERCCRACWRAPIATCSICGRRRPCHGASGPSPRCETCVKRLNTAACQRCGITRVVFARTAQGQPLCQRCAGPRERCVHCHRVRPVVGRPPDGPVCGACWRRDPAATHPCQRCGTVTWLHHFGLCPACACPEVLRELLTAADGTLRPAATTVLDVLAGDDNPAAVLKWLQAPTPRALLAALAEQAGPLQHTTLDRLRPTKAADRLRALLVARGALPARDEHLVLLERWIDTATAAIADVNDRRLVRRFATWHHLRRLRQLSTPDRPTGYGQISAARGDLAAAIAFLAWLRTRSTSIATAQQADVDDWLTSGPSSRHNASAFVSWAVRRRHAHDIDLSARSSTTHRRVLTQRDQRWQLARRLLHDNDLHAVDRVAGLLVLLHAQPVSRIAGLTVEHVEATPDGTHLRLGSTPIRLPPPLDHLVAELVGRRAGHTAVGRTAANRWLFPGAAPGQPLSAQQLGARLRRLGVPARTSRNTTLMDLAGQLPAAVLSQLLGLHLQTATNWTQEAGNTRPRYAAAVTTRTAPERHSSRPDLR